MIDCTAIVVGRRTKHQRRRAAFTLVELLVVIAVIGLLVGLLLPAVQAARESARRGQCVNNLKQIGLALRDFETARRFLPACAIGPNNDGSPYEAGWMTPLLPFLEQNNLFLKYNQNANWYDQVNQAVVNVQIPVYQCPSSITSTSHTVTGMIDDLSYQPPPGAVPISAATTDYTGIWGIDSSLYQANGMPAPLDSRGVLTTAFWPPPAGPVLGYPLSYIKDGLSSTLMVTECSNRPDLWVGSGLGGGVSGGIAGSSSGAVVSGSPWASDWKSFAPQGATYDGLTKPGPCMINCTNDWEVYSCHPSGANAVFVDGSVRFLSADIYARNFAALATRACAEFVDADKY